MSDHHLSEAQNLTTASSISTLISTSTRRVLSAEEWNELRPAIYQLYYAFTPTRRQFDRKVKEWGFKKNTSKDERLAIIKESTSGGQALRDVSGHGKVIKRAKRERCEKEFTVSHIPVNEPWMVSKEDVTRVGEWG
ncbi:hypothetical protein BJ878DRAFT_307295 [Calycina marina]|uniref:Clr5 domain-containing protein n=1 Tax=Calycina marina TaxID=1763456 RepID=A0A9P8CGS4_9HELO|nr:hypothetical protein BJ878DRAFT_307295 [Calycina marina]